MNIDLRGLHDESKRIPMGPQRVPESQKSGTRGSRDHLRGGNMAPWGPSGDQMGGFLMKIGSNLVSKLRNMENEESLKTIEKIVFH